MFPINEIGTNCDTIDQKQNNIKFLDPSCSKAANLCNCPEQIQLSPELMQIIVEKVVQSAKSLKDCSNLLLVSKDIRGETLLAFQELPLKQMGISTAEKEISYAKECTYRLRSINVSGISFTKEQMRELLSYLPSLRTLVAQRCSLDTEAIRAIATVSLQTLDLRENRIGTEAAKLLAESPWLESLKTLNLSFSELGDSGVFALAKSQTLRNLQILILSKNSIGDAGVKELAAMPIFSKLQKLNLRGNAIGFEGMEAISKAPLNHLQKLNLRKNQGGIAGLRVLMASQTLCSLKELNLGASGLRAEGAEVIANSPLSNQLEELDLSDNCLKAEGAQALAKFSAWTKLCRLNLTGNGIRIAGAVAIASSKHFNNLQILKLKGNGLKGLDLQIFSKTIDIDIRRQQP